ncbi:MAG TPA: DUF4625 domain-containing protein [Chitinophagaceae bacterium]
MKRGIIILLAIATLAACKKSASGDSEKPIINVTSPQANQQFNPGQVIQIMATVTDNSELHDVSLEITNKATSAILVHNHYHVDLMTYNLNETYTAGAGITYKMKIGATDHSGNTAEVEFEVKGN